MEWKRLRRHRQDHAHPGRAMQGGIFERFHSMPIARSIVRGVGRGCRAHIERTGAPPVQRPPCGPDNDGGCAGDDAYGPDLGHREQSGEGRQRHPGRRAIGSHMQAGDPASQALRHGRQQDRRVKGDDHAARGAHDRQQRRAPCGPIPQEHSAPPGTLQHISQRVSGQMRPPAEADRQHRAQDHRGAIHNVKHAEQQSAAVQVVRDIGGKQDVVGTADEAPGDAYPDH